MAKKPAGEAVHEPDPPPAVFTTPAEITHPAASNGAPRVSYAASSVPPPNIGVPNVPGVFTAVSDATAVITAQLALLTAQNTQADDLTAALPPDIASLPTNPDLQSITDALSGASRALGAYISQLNTLAILWPYTPPPP